MTCALVTCTCELLYIVLQSVELSAGAHVCARAVFIALTAARQHCWFCPTLSADVMEGVFFKTNVGTSKTSES